MKDIASAYLECNDDLELDLGVVRRLRDDGNGKVTETQQEKSPNGSQVPHYVFHREPSDGKLATSAQMYHYQHQKQKILAAEQ